MKVVGVVGSPRKNGNTQIMTEHALKAVAEDGLETELITLAGLDLRHCDGCQSCHGDRERCHINDDLMPLYEKLKAADGIILASPVYYGSATSLIKAMMDRVGFIGGGERRVFAGKAGGPLVVARRAGQNFTHAQLTYWFHILGFYMPGSTYWNVAFGREKGEISADEEGMATAWNFGKNMAHLVKKLNA